MKRKIYEVIAFVLTLVILLGVTSYLGYLYMPNRLDYGATWNMFLKEQEDSIDLMFVGSSMAYCDIIPAKIYEETGHTTYVLSAPYMMPDTAYYYITEALRTQSPNVIMLEATSFFFTVNEADYYKVNIGYMPYSVNRLSATLFTAPNDEKLGLLFPLFNYHDRWEQYGIEDYFIPRPDAKADLMAGYTLLEKAEPQTERFEREFLCTEEEYEDNISYLNMIKRLCDKEGIELELFIVPACEYVSAELTQDLREVPGETKVVNFNDNFDDMGFDLERDFFDKRHVNVNGAVKFSNYLSEYILQNYDLPSYEHDTELWAKRVEHINGKLS